MSYPNDPTRPYPPSPQPDKHPPSGPPPNDSPPADPVDPTLPYGSPPVTGSDTPQEGGPPPVPPPPGGGEGGDGGDNGLPPEPPEEPEGWWASRTPGELWAMGIGAVLLGVVIVWLIVSAGDDEPTATTTTVADTTTTTVADTTTTAPEEATTTAPEEATTTTAPEETTTAAPEEATTTTTAAPLPPPPSIEGNGNATTGFAIPGDLPAAVAITHSGEADFTVAAHDADRNETAVLIERVGDYQGTVGVNLDPDEAPVAFLQFTADGSWTAVATYLDDLDPMPLGGLGGTGDDVVRLEPLSSNQQAAFSHDGETDFIVTAHGADGRRNVLIDTSGEFAGTAVVPTGSVLLVITADGSWTVTIG